MCVQRHSFFSSELDKTGNHGQNFKEHNDTISDIKNIILTGLICEGGA